MARRKRSTRDMKKEMQKVRRSEAVKDLAEDQQTSAATSTSYRPAGKRKGFSPSRGAKKRASEKRKSKRK